MVPNFHNPNNEYWFIPSTHFRPQSKSQTTFPPTSAGSSGWEWTRSSHPWIPYNNASLIRHVCSRAPSTRLLPLPFRNVSIASNHGSACLTIRFRGTYCPLIKRIVIEGLDTRPLASSAKNAIALLTRAGTIRFYCEIISYLFRFRSRDCSDFAFAGRIEFIQLISVC